MSASHLPLRLHGEFLGDLITVGHRVVLFTVHHALAALDGCTFDNAEAALDAAAARLKALMPIRGLAA